MTLKQLYCKTFICKQDFNSFALEAGYNRLQIEATKSEMNHLNRMGTLPEFLRLEAIKLGLKKEYVNFNGGYTCHQHKTN